MNISMNSSELSLAVFCMWLDQDRFDMMARELEKNVDSRLHVWSFFSTQAYQGHRPTLVVARNAQGDY